MLKGHREWRHWNRTLVCVLFQWLQLRWPWSIFQGRTRKRYYVPSVKNYPPMRFWPWRRFALSECPLVLHFSAQSSGLCTDFGKCNGMIPELLKVSLRPGIALIGRHEKPPSLSVGHGANFTVGHTARFAVAQGHPRGPRMGSVKSPSRASYWSSI